MPIPSDDFEDLYEHAPCGYLLMLPDGRISRANATFSEWTGYPAEELVGKRLHDLLTIATRILYETTYAPLLAAHGTFEEISIDLRTATGARMPVFASGAVRKDANGQNVLTRIIMFKAFERRRYESQLIATSEASKGQERTTKGLLQTERETSELREQFIAVLGHDLRNPLASIAAGVRMLQRNPPAERRQFIQEMLQGSVIRMSGLIDNVLDFARGHLGAGIPLELRPSALLGPILKQIAEELRMGVAGRTIVTDIQLPEPVKCDPSRIGQLVSNLLGNALTHGTPESPVRLHADQANSVLTIWISNSGEPIPDLAMGRLFQPFSRGQDVAGQQGLGLGLGLYIASEIAKAHGGTLDVSSTGLETRFTFTMPLNAD